MQKEKQYTAIFFKALVCICIGLAFDGCATTDEESGEDELINNSNSSPSLDLNSAQESQDEEENFESSNIDNKGESEQEDLLLANSSPTDLEEIPPATQVATEAPIAATEEIPPSVTAPLQNAPTQVAPTQVSKIPRPTSPGVLWWLAHSYDRKNANLTISMHTKGRPQYDVREERSSDKKPQIILTFYDTKLRSKIKRIMDSADFRSPVESVVTRSDSSLQSVDVVITMRDIVRPKLYSRRGNIRLLFALSDQYLNASKSPQTPFYTPSQDFTVMPWMEEGSDAPRSANLLPVQKDDPTNAPAAIESAPTGQSEPEEAPDVRVEGAAIKWTSFSVGAVAQEELIPTSTLGADIDAPTADQNQVGTDLTQPTDSGVSYTGKPIVLEFHNAPLSEVLRAFSEQISTNFILAPSVSNLSVTIKLKQVPWDAALDAILETYSLGMAKVSENVIRVDKIDNMGSYLRLRDQAQQTKMLSEPRKVLVIRLSNAKADDDFASRMRSFFEMNGGIDNRTSINVDSRTNTVFIEAPPMIIARAKSLMQRLDVPEPQVEIVSRLIEVSRSANNFLGVSWNGGLNFDPGRGLGFGSLNFPNSVGSAFSVDPGVNGTATAGAVNFNIGSINDAIDIGLRLKMEETKGTTEILQSNRVLVADRQDAQISAGQSAYFKIAQSPVVVQPTQQQGASSGGGAADGGGSGGVTQRNFSLSLSATPEVTNDGNVKLKIKLSSEVPAAQPIPGADVSTNKRELSTILKKKSGETAVIGGIYDTRKTESETGIPYLSKIPILGALFRSKSKTEAQTEMMMLITPTIVNSDSGVGAEQGATIGLPTPDGTIGDEVNL